MRAVRSCDFCGDDADGTFEVVPDELLQSDADQRRVALCSHCRGTLESVLEPFVGGSPASADVIDESGGDNTAVRSTPTAETETAASDERTATTAAVDADARAEGIDIGRSDDEDFENDDPLAASEVVFDGESPSGQVAEPDAPEEPEEPDQFRKVMRLLNNREFPVERVGFTDLASGAYELDDDHVARIIDYAIDRGVIADDDGVLRKN